MPRTATNANGDVVIYNEQSDSWDPARTATNDKGDKVYFDGSAWQPLTSSAPSPAREGAASGGRTPAPAGGARSSPSPPPAPSFDPVEPLRMANRDRQATANEGLEQMVHGAQNFTAPFRGQGDPMSPESFGKMGLGLMQMPAGAIEYLGSPFTPLFRGPGEANRNTVGRGVKALTGSETAGNIAADTLTTGEGALLFGAGGRGAAEGPLRLGDPRGRGQIGPDAMKDITPESPQGPTGGSPMPALDTSPEAMHQRMLNREIIAQGPRTTHMDSGGYGAVRTSAAGNIRGGYGGMDPVQVGENIFRPDQAAELDRTLATANQPVANTPPPTPPQGNAPISTPPLTPPVVGGPSATAPADNNVQPLLRSTYTAQPTFDGRWEIINTKTGQMVGTEYSQAAANATLTTLNAPNLHNQFTSGPPQQPPVAPPPPAGPGGPGQTPPPGGPPGGAVPPAGAAPAQYNPPPSAVQLVRGAAKTIEKIISPTTVDANSRQAESDIREQIGLGRRDTEIARAALDEFNNQVRGMDANQRRSIISYVEGRSQGVPLANPAWQPLADTMRAAFKQREAKLANLPSTAQMSFVEDYYPHFWKDPRAAAQFAAQWQPTGKQGRGGFTKGRDIPTIEDGLNAGLTPMTLNPLEASMHYIANADRFIAINRVFDDARARGDIKYRYPGKQQAGEAEIHGRLGNKSDPNGVPMRAYAPEGWARVFNNFIDPGFTGPVGDVMNAAMKASNWVTALELSLSGFHTITMANEAMISSMARGLGELRTGHPVKATKAVADSAVAPVRTAMRGHAVQQVYQGKRTGSPMQQQIASLIARAGGQAVKMDRAWLSSRQGSYITAFKRGALKAELEQDLQDMKSRPLVGTASVGARHIARTMDTAMSWLFEHYIPKLKVGAFEEHMSAWLQRNPNAPADVVLQAARDLWDSTDNRFGEMVRDNIFWRNTLKQSSQLALRSYSWTFGAGREIGGGAWDAAKAPFTGKWTPRMDYVIALPIVYGIWAAVYQMLKTGQPPQDTQDMLAPRTGGVDAKGMPERVIPPGFMKDVFGWANKGILGELWAKTATLPRTAYELATNQDWRGLPIAPGSHVDDPNAPPWLVAYFNHVMENLGPFGVKNALKGQPQGSNLSTGESLLGFQPAGRQMTDPEGYNRTMKGIETKAWQRKVRADDREQRRYKGPVE